MCVCMSVCASVCDGKEQQPADPHQRLSSKDDPHSMRLHAAIEIQIIIFLKGFYCGSLESYCLRNCFATLCRLIVNDFEFLWIVS